MTDRRRRGLRTALVASAAIAVAAAGLLMAIFFAPSPSQAEVERDVFSTLRCPVCAGESIADSTAPVSAAMREEAARQLADGRTTEEVLEWFAQTYGAGILLEPCPQGAGLLMWAMPVAAVAIAAVAVTLFVRRSRTRRRPIMLVIAMTAAAVVVAVIVDVSLGAREDVAGDVAADPGVESAAVAESVLEASARERPADAAVRVAYGLVLHERGDAHAAAGELGAAVRLRPSDPHLAFLHASLLTESGQADAAGEALEHVLAVQPDHGPALLARGTMLVREGDERGREMLEDFLRHAPHDPAAENVRALLEEDADASG